MQDDQITALTKDEVEKIRIVVNALKDKACDSVLDGRDSESDAYQIYVALHRKLAASEIPDLSKVVQYAVENKDDNDVKEYYQALRRIADPKKKEKAKVPRDENEEEDDAEASFTPKTLRDLAHQFWHEDTDAFDGLDKTRFEAIKSASKYLLGDNRPADKYFDEANVLYTQLRDTQLREFVSDADLHRAGLTADVLAEIVYYAVYLSKENDDVNDPYRLFLAIFVQNTRRTFSCTLPNTNQKSWSKQSFLRYLAQTDERPLAQTDRRPLEETPPLGQYISDAEANPKTPSTGKPSKIRSKTMRLIVRLVSLLLPGRPIGREHEKTIGGKVVYPRRNLYQWLGYIAMGLAIVIAIVLSVLMTHFGVLPFAFLAFGLGTSGIVMSVLVMSLPVFMLGMMLCAWGSKFVDIEWNFFHKLAAHDQKAMYLTSRVAIPAAIAVSMAIVMLLHFHVIAVLLAPVFGSGALGFIVTVLAVAALPLAVGAISYAFSDYGFMNIVDILIDHKVLYVVIPGIGALLGVGLAIGLMFLLGAGFETFALAMLISVMVGAAAAGVGVALVIAYVIKFYVARPYVNKVLTAAQKMAANEDIELIELGRMQRKLVDSLAYSANSSRSASSTSSSSSSSVATPSLDQPNREGGVAFWVVSKALEAVAATQSLLDQEGNVRERAESTYEKELQKTREEDPGRVAGASLFIG